MSERESEEIVIDDIDTLFEVLNDKNTNYKKVSYSNELNKRRKHIKEKQLEEHNLIVTKLYNDKNNIKMAHLRNSNIDIDVDFVVHFFNYFSQTQTL